jgi:hypothetical protein
MNQATNKVEVLFYLSGAFKNAIEGGFLAREHAASIFKSALRDAGYEIAKKKTQGTEEV